MVNVFPPGNNINQASATGATNLLGYANAGGRVFATHTLCLARLRLPYNSQFTVANWTVGAERKSYRQGTVNTGFTTAQRCAVLQNAGATVTGPQIRSAQHLRTTGKLSRPHTVR